MDKFFSKLPDLVLVKILNLLNIRDILNLGSANNAIRDLISHKRKKTTLKSLKYADMATVNRIDINLYSSIEILDFTGCAIADNDMNQITVNGNISLLHSVCFNYCQLSDKSLIPFFEKCNKHMVYIGLAGCFVSQEVLQIIKTKARSLMVLDLDHIKVPAQDIIELIQAAEELEHLSLGLIDYGIVPTLRYLTSRNKLNIMNKLISLTYGVSWECERENITCLLELLSTTGCIKELNLVNATVYIDQSEIIKSYASLETCVLTYCSDMLLQSFKKVNKIKIESNKATSVPPIESFLQPYFRVVDI